LKEAGLFLYPHAMLTSARIKWIKALNQKKTRTEEGFFVAEGDKIIRELLISPWKTQHIYALPSWIETNNIPTSTDFTPVSRKELERISFLKTPNRAVAIVKIPENSIENIVWKNKHTLFLDNIQDPGNIGTIIRTADWFGVENIICTPDSADIYNPKVIQATMGSFLRVRVFYMYSEDLFGNLPVNIPIAGAMLGGQDIFQTKPFKESILVIGNESKGISPAISKHLTKKILIPRKSSNTELPESLNAAVATAIILAHVCR
jgi:RNA methyltransferase, TrmH family